MANWLDGQVGDALKHGHRALARHHTDCPPNHSALWVAVMLTAVHEYDQALAVLDPTTPDRPEPNTPEGSAPHDLARHVVAARVELDRECPGAELEDPRRALRGRQDELP